MKTLKQFALVLVLLLIPLAIGADPAMAFSGYLNGTTAASPGFNRYYSAVATPAPVGQRVPPAPSTSGTNASCNICHSSGGGTDLNGYGKDWAAQHNAGLTTAQAFQAVEGLNSDGASLTNLQEITANAQPGWAAGANNQLYDQFSLAATTRASAPTITGNLLDPAAATNQPPVLALIGAKSVNEGQALAFTASATDPNGNALTFSAGGLPTGATFTPAGAFSWTPTFAQAGSYNATITVTDNGTPPASDFEIVTITVGNVNRPPVLAPIGAKTVNENQALTFTATATDPDGGTLTFSGSNLPTGATLNATTGAFSWTPTFNQGQSPPYSVTVIVTDVGGLNDQETFTVTVGNVNRPPVLAPIGAKTVNANAPLTFTATATDPDGGALTFAATNLPAGATLNATTGAFSWTPTSGQAGNYPVTVTVTDVGSPPMSDSETFTITVGNVNRPPVLAPIGNRTGTAGQLLSFTINASDPDGGTLTFTATGLPSGATLTPGTNGIATFSWTPTAAQVSATPYSVTVAVSDGALSDPETFTITVNAVTSSAPPANQAPTVTNPGNKTVTAGSLLSFTITATDPNAGQTRSFSAGTTLPTGATLNATTGAFAWTPTAAQVRATPYSVTVTATDTGTPPLTSAPVTFTITVNAPASTGLDYSIASFTATREVVLRSRTQVTFRLAVRNVGTTSGSVPVTLVGSENGVEVYRRTMQVSGRAGTTTTLGFLPYAPTRAGTIRWTVTIQDPVPGNNTATATTEIERRGDRRQSDDRRETSD